MHSKHGMNFLYVAYNNEWTILHEWGVNYLHNGSILIQIIGGNVYSKHFLYFNNTTNYCQNYNDKDIKVSLDHFYGECFMSKISQRKIRSLHIQKKIRPFYCMRYLSKDSLVNLRSGEQEYNLSWNQQFLLKQASSF